MAGSYENRTHSVASGIAQMMPRLGIAMGSRLKAQPNRSPTSR
jgi:hypothetical protein